MKKDDLTAIEVLKTKGCEYKNELMGTIDGMKKWTARCTAEAASSSQTTVPGVLGAPSTPAVSETGSAAGGHIKKVEFFFYRVCFFV